MTHHVIVPNPLALADYIGTPLGPSSWFTVTQERINAFAQATGDDQWIHLDPERAEKESLFGTTIAHGYLSIALFPTLLLEILKVQNCRMIVNRSIQKLKMFKPVLAGSRVRLTATIKSARNLRGEGMLTILDVSLEGENLSKPICSGTVTLVYYV